MNAHCKRLLMFLIIMVFCIFLSALYHSLHRCYTQATLPFILRRSFSFASPTTPWKPMGMSATTTKRISSVAKKMLPPMLSKKATGMGLMGRLKIPASPRECSSRLIPVSSTSSDLDLDLDPDRHPVGGMAS